MSLIFNITIRLPLYDGTNTCRHRRRRCHRVITYGLMNYSWDYLLFVFVFLLIILCADFIATDILSKDFSILDDLLASVGETFRRECQLYRSQDLKKDIR